MTNLRRETRWMSLTLILSGAIILAVGVLAAVLPEETLIPSTLAVGLIAALSGLNQILSAVSSHARGVSVFQYLFFGAIYAALFGASQLIAGIRLRKMRLEDVQLPPADVPDWQAVTRRPRHLNS